MPSTVLSKPNKRRLTRSRGCLQRFGLKPWVDCEPIRELAETDMAFWLREDVEVL